MATEKRMIDYGTATRATYEEIFWTESEQAAVRSFLTRLPKVHAVEVVHGHWEYGKWEQGHWVKGNERCRRSVCHRDFAVDNLNIWHGCPQCLAKMDGDGNEDV